MGIAEKRAALRKLFDLSPEIKAVEKKQSARKPRSIPDRTLERINVPSHLQTVSEDQAAEITGLAVRTLQQRRWLGKPPVYLKVGRLVRYRVSDLEKYLDSCTVEPAETTGGDEC